MKPHISLRDVRVTYPIGRDNTLKNFILDLFRRRKVQRAPVAVEALRGVTLEINSGERIGIIGRNGSGKSTLLRVMGGLFPATSGDASCVGRIGALSSLTQGFEVNASGWDNIELRSLVIGATHAQIRAKRDEIAEFSGLGDFLLLPMRCYSSGMLARLGFAISTAYDPDVLLVDEVMGAGDADFQKRARGRMEELMERSGLLVLVTHALATIPELCTRVIYMRQGVVAFDGDPQHAIAAYRDDVKQGQSMTIHAPVTTDVVVVEPPSQPN
jgi:lipopolysaccharide transport system ATP-binding protein